MPDSLCVCCCLVCRPTGPYDPRQYLGGLAVVPESWRADLRKEQAKAAVPWQRVTDHIHRHGEAAQQFPGFQG